MAAGCSCRGHLRIFLNTDSKDSVAYPDNPVRITHTRYRCKRSWPTQSLPPPAMSPSSTNRRSLARMVRMRGDKISAVVMDPKQQPTVPQTMAKRIHSAALGEWSQKPRPRKGPSDAIDPRVSLSIKRKLRGKCIHGQDWVNNANHTAQRLY